MITVESVLGNIYRDRDLGEKHKAMSVKSRVEVVRINRLEAQRVRMRKKTDKGTDIAMTMPAGTKLRHGDVVLLSEEKMVVMELEPEKVAVVEVKHLHEDDAIGISVRIGHTIGNLHRPIKLDGDRIVFPIQAESEVEMFRKLFGPLMHHLEIKGDVMVFEPEESMDVHEH
jgi:urease accessory protein